MQKTALITGASSGIGLELARLFAKDGHDIVLVARDDGRLREVATELAHAHGVAVRAITADFSIAGASQHVYDTCQAKGIRVEYLVNSAGFGDFGPFVEAEWGKTESMMEVNMKALTHLCHLFIPEMVGRREGCVLNIASTAAFQPGPLMAVYYATKAYVLSFSQALHEELRETGVRVTCLCPGATRTGFQQASAMSESRLVKGRSLPTAAEVAAFGYRAMREGRLVAIHGRYNAFIARIVTLLPRAVVLRMVREAQEKV